MKWTLPNIITISRLLLVAPFVYCLFYINSDPASQRMRYIALGIFIIMTISDALDGFLARILNQFSALGAFLDPMADKLIMMASCVMLAFPATTVRGFQLPWIVAVLIIGKDIYLLIGYFRYRRVTKEFEIEPVWAGKFGAALQFMMIGGILAAPDISKVIPFWGLCLYFTYFLVIAFSYSALYIYIVNAKKHVEMIKQGMANSAS